MSSKVIGANSYGIDVGGTKIELAVFDEHLQRMSATRVDTPTRDYDEFLHAIAGLVDSADRLGTRAEHIGLCLPCTVQGEKLSLSANIPCLSGKHLQQDLTQQLGRRVAQLTLMYDPDVIVLGGGLSIIPDIYDNLSDFGSPHLFGDVGLPPVRPPMFGDSSGVRGVAQLARKQG